MKEMKKGIQERREGKKLVKIKEGGKEGGQKNKKMEKE